MCVAFKRTKLYSTSCTLSPLFHVSLHRTVFHGHCHLFFIFHYTQLYFMYIDTCFFIFHYTELYFMHIVTSFLCFTTHSCTSCTLSPLFYVSLHTAVLHVHCHLFFYISLIPVNLWELLGGDLPPTNPSKGVILCVTFKRTKLYLVVAYM